MLDSSVELNKNQEFSHYNEGPKSTSLKTKRSSLACIRCRTRHTKCPGGEPCRKCQLAKTRCEYVEADKKIVVSMKYLSKLHDDIARLKKDNANIRNELRQTHEKTYSASTSSSNEPIHVDGYSKDYSKDIPMEASEDIDESQNGSEVITPSLDKHGRLIQSRTGEKLYAGSSSMTLFGLEIQNMISPAGGHSSISSNASFDASPSAPISSQDTLYNQSVRETEILEKEGNAYRITLSKTNTRPGLSVNFELPSYSYAMLLIDTFINYNDACFYFFNEGLMKQFLMNLYSGKAEENRKILKRNKSLLGNPGQSANSIKRDTDDDRILESVWFCKILLIFAVGEMYLGTESDTVSKSKAQNSTAKGRPKNKKERKNTLPGSGFFYQASELFTGLFASAAIDNITRDGGIEVILLYAFFLQVADCTIASYFYFGLALRSALTLGWHVDADKDSTNRFELEHRRRIWWTVYMYERMLSSKAGLPLSFSDDSVSTALPADFDMSIVDSYPNDVRQYYIFPRAEYINNCVKITQINATILSSLYTKQPKANILPTVSTLVKRLIQWRHDLPESLKVDFSSEDVSVKRLTVNLMTEYFHGMNLAVRPLLFHFAAKNFKEMQAINDFSQHIDLNKYSKNIFQLLNASFQASINTIKSLWALMPENMVAMFGWMDREYLFSSASTLVLFNASFGVHEATRVHLDNVLVMFTKMKRLGNHPAALRRAQLLKLMEVLNFNGFMDDLLSAYADDKRESPQTIDAFSGMNSFKTRASQDKYTDDVESTNVVHAETDCKVVPGNSKLRWNSDNLSDNNINLHNSHGVGQQVDVASLEPSFGKDSLPEISGLEDFPHLDEEHDLWNEITNDAAWLSLSNHLESNNDTDGPKCTEEVPEQQLSNQLQGESQIDVPDLLSFFNRNFNVYH